MELRVKRIRPGEVSIHSETGSVITNAEHRETRYLGDEVITHIVIRTLASQMGKFTRMKSKQEKEEADDSSPA